MATSLEECVKSLSSSGLMSDVDVKQFIDELPPDSRPDDSRSLLAELVKRHRLTRYQADALASGVSHPLVLGDHVVLERLGAGGMGVVYKAWNRRMDRVVALKLLPPEATQSGGAVERFRREVKAAARLSHFNIVATYHADEQNGTHYLVMEYIDGLDLLRLVRHRGPFTVAQAVGLVVHAARGLQYAHSQGVIHRDVKPSNLMLDREGNVKILDLGLARIGDSKVRGSGGSNQNTDDLTSAGDAMGTLGYIAPEQNEDARGADHRSDIYSLGCTLYFLITGKSLHSGDSSGPSGMRLGASIPSSAENGHQGADGLNAVFQRMIAQRPDERYASMAEVVEALQAFRRPELEANDSSVLQDISLVADDSQLLDTTHSTDRSSNQRQAGKNPPRVSKGALLIRRCLVAGLFLLIVVGGWLAAPHVIGRFAATELPVVAKVEFNAQQARLYQDNTARFLSCDRKLVNSIGMQFLLLPAHRAGPEAEGEVMKPCFLGAHEVTQEDYLRVIGENPSGFQRGGECQQQLIDVQETSRYPVENVSRDEALQFCRLLSELSDESRTGRVYRLPTAAEWEFACRAGGAPDPHAADDYKLLGQYAWYDANSAARPHTVGLLKPNAFGFYDMLGNVKERASDEKAGRFLIVGNSFGSWAASQTADKQRWVNEPVRHTDLGFRVVCETTEIRNLRIPVEE